MKLLYYLFVIVLFYGCTERVEQKQPITMMRGDLVKVQSTEPMQVSNVALLYNPEHGKPGHTCALPVGAPLKNAQNTPVSAPQPSTATNMQVSQPVAPQVVVNPNDSRPNPPHGQPSHRCDIPVGTPLNTKASAAAPQSQPAVVATKPGMNPPHGQPNHRCDIAVGAPLIAKAMVPTSIAPATSSDSSKSEGVSGGK